MKKLFKFMGAFCFPIAVLWMIAFAETFLPPHYEKGELWWETPTAISFVIMFVSSCIAALTIIVRIIVED